MKERPILFSAPMVRAILEGRKTQTRREVKQYKPSGIGNKPVPADLAYLPDFTAYRSECPYGKPGDRLWVRETSRAEELESGLDGVRYMADGAFREIDNTEAAADRWLEMNAYRGEKGAQVPSIHMPRWASRILLEIVSVRVERLTDCSDADALAEGVDRTNTSIPGYARQRFEWLWESINGPGSWSATRWVWMVEFKRVEGGAA